MTELGNETKLAQFFVEFPPLAKSAPGAFIPMIAITPSALSAHNAIGNGKFGKDDEMYRNSLSAPSVQSVSRFSQISEPSPNLVAYKEYVSNVGREPENATQLVLYARNNQIDGIQYKRAREIVSDPQEAEQQEKRKSKKRKQERKEKGKQGNESENANEYETAKQEDTGEEKREEKPPKTIKAITISQDGGSGDGGTVETQESLIEPRGLFETMSSHTSFASSTNDGGDEKTITESSIAQLLRLSLMNITSQARKNHLFELNDNAIDSIGNKICLEIIKAFKLLFNKYVDESTAIFLMYLSTNNVEKMKNLFHNFNSFTNLRKQRKERKANKTSTASYRKDTEMTTKSSVVPNTNMLGALNTFFRGAKVDETIIERELKVMLDMEKENDQLKNKHVFKWLLAKIVIAIEPSMEQTSTLLTDSFERFKINNNILFEKLSIHVTNHKKRGQSRSLISISGNSQDTSDNNNNNLSTNNINNNNN